MINANIEQFLDNGWYSEATLFYRNHTYWCEGFWDKTKKKPFQFFVYRYKSEICKDNSGNTWSRRLEDNGDIEDYAIVFVCEGINEAEVKETFLKAKIFDGKSFWEVEKDLAWYDEA